MKILTLDIETQPILAHVWGIWQQNVSIKQIKESGQVIMWAGKWLGEKEVHIMDDHADGHEAMIKGAHAVMSEADVIVGHNVAKFDVKYLNTEFIKLGLAPPDPSKMVDTLTVVKQRFRFESNKLDYVAQQLGVGSKLVHSGFELWIGWMANNKTDVDKMRRYCIQDVRLTERLYKKLVPWAKSHPNMGLYVETDKPTCPNCASTKVHKKGLAYTAVGIYQRFRCSSCGTPLRGRTTTLSAEQRQNILIQEK